MINHSTFQHAQSAHCESGVVSNLFRHHGMQISEPMAFGIGAGIFFGHLPFVKVNGVPGTTYRTFPGAIFNKASKRLGVTVRSESFRSPEKAMQALDEKLAQGTPVGLLSSVYYLPYFPPAYRFHFNAHNLVVYGKKDGNYLVSDPIMDVATEIDPESLVAARFAKGFPEPKGKMYYPVAMPDQVKWEKPIQQGIEQACHYMLKIPVPLFGVKGMRFLAKRIQKYPHAVGDRKAGLFLGNVIRMQEEIGTGGAGFRFMYAAFLQEAAQQLNKPVLSTLGTELTAVGDLWRNFAFQAGRVCKSRAGDETSYKDLGDMMVQCAAAEEVLFRRLAQVKF
ncbi:Butirosin biosynthesis protein H, N-terminal [Chitinophaga costaii]|uniref:Butirosin biosynthesis protein H, N-terminal n=1 Tax=Chitinophaga costaii TaxID=1335309 RepID=A0A1C4C2B8_9BACT|nr:BtrH N-terminal domain-containing protein [Chitinophaga costaii]PUZ27363.1 DUF4872 domain-containing protein [Chitinophaga costaii]SCC13269.1 Butirosin biosynthesis protein H, N-terminal [Chitinophaga costaii]